MPDGAPAASPVAPVTQPVPTKSASPPASKFLGNDVPIFDPSSEVVSWDGHNWNLNNNRIFEARFEKYLNAPEETSEADLQYQKIISTILDKLAPGATAASVDEAFSLLPKASASRPVAAPSLALQWVEIDPLSKPKHSGSPKSRRPSFNTFSITQCPPLLLTACFVFVASHESATLLG